MRTTSNFTYVPKSLPKLVPAPAGKEVSLKSYYGERLANRGVAFNIAHLPYPQNGRGAEVHRFTLEVRGQVQGVAFRATATNIFRAIGHGGVPGARFAPSDSRSFSAENDKNDKSLVRITMEATTPEKDQFMAVVNGAFHVVFGTEKDFKEGKCVVVKAGKAVPKDAFNVYSPRVDEVRVITDEALGRTRYGDTVIDGQVYFEAP